MSAEHQAASPPPTRAQQRARAAAENAEWAAPLDRLRAHHPNFDCFCGSLDDLRRHVATLDRRAAWTRPAPRQASAGRGSPPATGDTQLAAHHAGQAGHSDDEAAARRDQFNRWHRHDTHQIAASADDDTDGSGSGWSP